MADERQFTLMTDDMTLTLELTGSRWRTRGPSLWEWELAGRTPPPRPEGEPLLVALLRAIDAGKSFWVFVTGHTDAFPVAPPVPMTVRGFRLSVINDTPSMVFTGTVDRRKRFLAPQELTVYGPYTKDTAEWLDDAIASGHPINAAWMDAPDAE